MPLSTVFQYIVAISFIDAGNRSNWRKPPTCRKSVTKYDYYMFLIIISLSLLHVYDYYMSMITTSLWLLNDYAYYMFMITLCLWLLHVYDYYMIMIILFYLYYMSIITFCLFEQFVCITYYVWLRESLYHNHLVVGFTSTYTVGVHHY